MKLQLRESRADLAQVILEAHRESDLELEVRV